MLEVRIPFYLAITVAPTRTTLTKLPFYFVSFDIKSYYGVTFHLITVKITETKKATNVLTNFRTILKG